MLTVIFSTIASVASAVCSAIATVATSVKPAVEAVASVLGPLSGKMLEAFKTVCTIIETIAKIFDIIPQSEALPEFGERVLQAEEQGITLESCNNDYQKYLEEIKKVEIDINATHDETRQLAAGLCMAGKILEMKDSRLTIMNPDSWKYLMMNPDFFKERLILYANMAQEKDVNLGDVINTFFGRSGSFSDSIRAKNFLFEAEQRLHPEVSGSNIKSIILEARDFIEQDKYFLTVKSRL